MDAHPRDRQGLAAVAAVFADPRRVRVLVALADGRALPAGRLAEEAGVAASTVSGHLALLREHGLVEVEQQGRHRYYRLASPHVEAVLSALARLAPPAPVTSLREHTRARALRAARTCYGHLAGQLGVRLFAHLLDSGAITGGDGRHRSGGDDRFAAPGRDCHYRLTDAGARVLRGWGVPAESLQPDGPLRYCIDWTEQAHHLGGPLGAGVADALVALGALVPGRVPRSLVVVDGGRHWPDGLHAVLAG